MYRVKVYRLEPRYRQTTELPAERTDPTICSSQQRAPRKSQTPLPLLKIQKKPKTIPNPKNRDPKTLTASSRPIESRVSSPPLFSRLGVRVLHGAGRKVAIVHERIGRVALRREGSATYSMPCFANAGAFVIRIGFWGPLYYNYNNEPSNSNR